MTPNPPLPARRKVNAAVLLICATVFVTLPILIFIGVFFWLNQTSFNAVEELKVEELESIQIELKNLPKGKLNRPDPLEATDVAAETATLDGTDPDIKPTKLIRPDFEIMLGPLRDATPIEQMQWPASAYLGKFQIRYKDGRGGTIMLYWAAEQSGNPNSPARVWMAIGGQRYRACTLKDLRTVAEMCASRGRPQ